VTVHISRGNSKLGKHIANISLPPVATCPKGVPCASGSCYAHKAWRQYPNVRRAWGENLAELVMNKDRYFVDILKWIWANEPEHFRWHVAGDIPNQEYLDVMAHLAWLTRRRTRHLAFTKRYELDYGDIPENLSIIISAWPGYGVIHVPCARSPTGFLPIAWCQDGTETRIPLDAVECKGKCDACLYCWTATRDVWFHKH